MDIIKKTIAIILFIAVSVILLSCEKENNVSSLKALEGKWMRLDKVEYLFNGHVSYEEQFEIVSGTSNPNVYFSDSNIMLIGDDGLGQVLPYVYVNNTLYTSLIKTFECYNFQINGNTVSFDILKGSSLRHKAKYDTREWFNQETETSVKTSLSEYLAYIKDRTFIASIAGLVLEHQWTALVGVVAEDIYGKTIYSYDGSGKEVLIPFYYDDNNKVVFTDYLEFYNKEDDVYEHYYYDTARLYGTIQ